MLSNAKRAAISITAFILVWVFGSLALRLVFGKNYVGSTLQGDISINMGIVLFFAISSGFMITYIVKNYIKPPITVSNILLSVALVTIHSLLYSILFMHVNWGDALTIITTGVICVTLVELILYLAILKRKLGA